MENTRIPGKCPHLRYNVNTEQKQGVEGQEILIVQEVKVVGIAIHQATTGNIDKCSMSEMPQKAHVARVHKSLK